MAAARVPTGSTAPGWASQEWRVFGTGARMVLAETGDGAAARRAVDDVLAAVDLAASRFRQDSEISALNRADGQAVVVSELFAELIRVGLDAAQETAGAVDPTLGAQLQQLGYDQTFRDVPRNGPAITVQLRRPASWRAVEFDREARTVRLPAGVQLDLGATAKAHASDLAAAAAHAATGAPVLISLGGDIAVAGDTPEGGWTIAVAEDSAAELSASHPLVTIAWGGLATSSTTVRRWRRGEEVVHHLLDPLTARPATGPWRTATVAGRTCLEANVAATAAIVLGSSAPPWLAARGLPARLVSRTGDVQTVRGWPDEERT